MNERLDDFLASYAGCDGGNPKARVWVCGIEHGGTFEPSAPLVPEPTPGSWDDAFRREHPDYWKWQYNRKVAKLMIGLRSLAACPDRTPDLSGNKQYMDEIYTSNGETFKLNLFPLSSPSDKAAQWRQAYEHFGLPDKDAYRQRCRDVRFPFFCEMRQQYRPRMIVGTGMSYREFFAEAFGFPESSRRAVRLQSDRAQRDCHQYADDGASLVVCPFFGGRYGMNSDGLLIELARLIHATMTAPGA